MEIRDKFLNWFRKLLLNQIHNECRWQAKINDMDELEFFTEVRVAGVLAALDNLDPRAKKTVREIVNWYLYGMVYVRAYARARKGDRSGKKPV